VRIVAIVLQALVVALSVVYFAVQCSSTLRFVFSSSYRRRTRERWRESHLSVLGKILFAVLCFLVFGLVVAGILWRIFVGPVPPVHEWFAPSR